MHSSIASRAVACPSLRLAFHRATALYLLGSRSIRAPGLHPPALEPKCSSRCRALSALCVLMPWRPGRPQNRAAAAHSPESFPARANAAATTALLPSLGIQKIDVIGGLSLPRVRYGRLSYPK